MRRFIVQDSSGVVVGVIADDVSWAMYGLSFENKLDKEKNRRQIVLGFAPGAWKFFRELNDNEKFGGIRIYSGEGQDVMTDDD